MAPDVIVALVGAMLGGGGLAFVQAVVGGIAGLRAGARTHERESVHDLSRARDAADERAGRAETDRDYWRDIAGHYRYQLTSAGLTPEPERPAPPSTRPA